MVILADQEIQIDKIVNEMKRTDNLCPRDFRCLTSNFTNIGRIEDIGLKNYLVCKEENAQRCVFAIPFGNAHFCTCPLRRYLARELKV